MNVSYWKLYQAFMVHSGNNSKRSKNTFTQSPTTWASSSAANSVFPERVYINSLNINVQILGSNITEQKNKRWTNKSLDKCLVYNIIYKYIVYHKKSTIKMKQVLNLVHILEFFDQLLQHQLLAARFPPPWHLQI